LPKGTSIRGTAKPAQVPAVTELGSRDPQPGFNSFQNALSDSGCTRLTFQRSLFHLGTQFSSVGQRLGNTDQECEDPELRRVSETHAYGYTSVRVASSLH
jgi:hypothetical protein